MSNPEKIAFPVVVSGPSGVGKTTLCHGLIERESGLAFSISATTRPARGSEKHGEDYFFITREEFERMKTDREFAESALVHGEFYGTPKAWLEERLTEGISIMLDIDVQGGVQIMDVYPDSVSIFIVPPSFRILEERLRNRRSETEEAVKQRLENALKEMEYITRYTYVVINDTVESAVSAMRHIVAGERLRRERVLKNVSWQEFVGLEGKGV